MQYVEKKVSELYPAKDVITVILLLAIVIPIGISVAGFVTTMR